MGLYSNGLMKMDPMYGQIMYNCWLSNAFKLRLGHNPKIFLVEIKRVRGMDIAEHIMRSAKVIPTSRVKARCKHLLIIILRLGKVLKRVVEERRERRMVGKRMILLLM